MKRSSLNFDVSVSGSKRRGGRTRGMSGAFEGAARKCEWDGCEKEAKYRAPKSREQLNEFRWFCLDHVREYNSRWNYYENMTEDEIQASMSSDQVWGRPTWKLGEKSDRKANVNPHADGQAWKRFGFEDPLEVLGENGTLNPGSRTEAREVRERLLPKGLRRALAIMQLDALATKKDIRLRYKELVKRFHPDQNGGDRSEEARLREVLWAWDQLKNAEMFPE